MKKNLTRDVIITEVFQKKCLFERMSSSEDDTKINYSYSYGVVINDKNHGAAELILFADGVSGEGKKPLFQCEISFIGMFYLEKSKSKKMMQDFLDSEAPAILLPYIRESLSTLSIKAGLPPILLPPTDLNDMLSVQDWERESTEPQENNEQ